MIQIPKKNTKVNDRAFSRSKNGPTLLLICIALSSSSCWFVSFPFQVMAKEETWRAVCSSIKAVWRRRRAWTWAWSSWLTCFIAMEVSLYLSGCFSKFIGQICPWFIFFIGGNDDSICAVYIWSVNLTRREFCLIVSNFLNVHVLMKDKNTIIIDLIHLISYPNKYLETFRFQQLILSF